MLVTAPPEPFARHELQGKPVVGIAALYVGDPEHVLQPLKDLGPAAQIAPMP